MSSEVEYEARGHAEDSPLSISQLNWFIKRLLEQSLPSVWVEGEISDLSRPSSGHMYFTLKDDSSQIRGVMWRSTAQRLKFQLKDGMAVLCRGAVEVYPPRGSYQLIVQAIQPQGVGALQLAFQQLHRKLSQEGLFDESRKRPLPRFPRRIGFVTSPSGAALHDFLESARGLWNDLELTIIPSRVQGELATEDLVAGIRAAQQIDPPLDVLIVGRGGGSIEDLWCFNEEAVVRALAACTIPTVSAVGHEIDVTLCDLAADARALTPTQAAGLILPNRKELQTYLLQAHRRLDKGIWARVTNTRQRLSDLASRTVLSRPHDIHKLRRQMIDEVELRARASIWNLLKRRSESLASLARATEALSPLNVLSRGYTLTQTLDTQETLRSVEGLEPGRILRTVFPDGAVTSEVQSVDPTENEDGSPQS